jgi:hypothetical protein
MASPLDLIFGQVANAISRHSSSDTPGPSYDPNPLLGALQGIFGNNASQTGHQFNPNPQYGDGQDFHSQYGNVSSSDQDPWGDPGAQGQQSYNGPVASSNEDPWGDPGATGQQPSNSAISSSNEDPWGDPGAQGR